MSDRNQAGDDLFGVTIAGRYRLLSRLGVGGMGVAYRAWDEEAGVPVVVKIPKKSFLEDPTFVERFGREIRLLQGLSHPHIVPILDVGEHDGLPFIVMRFLPGGSLSNRRLRDGSGGPLPNPPGMLHLWLPAVAAALDWVHGTGVVHRDVKPANIFFDAFWGAYLGDFGIAKIVSESESFDREQTLTASQMLIGTQEYMAPEQFMPRAVVDGRVDQYALAVIVYEMLSGSRPFTGKTAHLIVEVTTQPAPQLDSRQGRLPASLVSAVQRGLAKAGGERFGTCAEFAAAALADVPPMQDEPGVARLLCPQCSNMLKLPTAAAGRKGNCPKCRTQMKVAADLGSLWLLDEAPRQRQGGGDGPDSRGGAATSGSFTPLSSTTWIAQTFGRPGAKRGAMIAGGVLVAALAFVLAWRGVSGPGSPQDERPPSVDVPSGQPTAVATADGVVTRNARPEQPPVVDPVVSLPRKTEVAATSGTTAAAPFAQEVNPRPGGGEAAVGVDVAGGTGFGTRGNPGRAAAEGGGGPHTEAAVDSALMWFIEHQLPDGGWSFDLKECPKCTCSSTCSPDIGADRCAATAMALLPFLGRGYTHKAGPYTDQVGRGLAFLSERSVLGNGNVAKGSRFGGYSQGLATIVLAEAHGMTHDKQLRYPAQAAAFYITTWQNPVTGGWDYYPYFGDQSKRGPGNTSISSWNVMALKAAEVAGLRVSPLSCKRAAKFLDSLAVENGAKYLYRDGGRFELSASAAGLLTRIHLGMKLDDPALKAGVQFLASQQEQNIGDIYYAYFTTQIMHHVQGPPWDAWNAKMQATILPGQATTGHEKGSWCDGLNNGPDDNVAGRLYVTSLATLMLEVYYRHTSLFGDQSIAKRRGGIGAEDASDSKPVASRIDGSPAAASPQEILAQPPLVNSIGMELKLIPSGTFQMGSKDCSPEEQPVHEVRITTPFYLGVTEVTNAQWKKVMGSVPSTWKDDDRPVEQVSWGDAMQFCEKLSALPAEKAARRVYRLPTEAEWEYSCRAGTKARYSFGDDESQLGVYAWFHRNSGAKTHVVAQHKPNAWGLYDMHGNVWEWCSDCYGDYGSDAVTDPQGASTASARVSRGGSWGDTATDCQSAHRRGPGPSIRNHYLGFRLALSSSGTGVHESRLVADQASEPVIARDEPQGPKQRVERLRAKPVFQLTFDGDWKNAGTPSGIRAIKQVGSPAMVDDAHGPGIRIPVGSHLEVDLTDVIPLGNSDRTTSLWVRTHTLPQQHPAAYLSYGSIDKRNQAWSICVGQDGYYFDGNWHNAGTSRKPPLGAWEHLAAIKRGNVTEVWVNGVLSGTVVGPTNTQGATLLVGHSLVRNAQVGIDVDEVMIWDHALSEAELETLYESSKPAPILVTKLPELVNSIGMKFKLIPAGMFQMGSEDGDASEMPVHEVRIRRPFYLGVFEVTNAEWKEVMGSVPSNWKDDNSPVERVSLDDVEQFCEKLSARPAEKAAGRVYRLPTEAEWEYACRAGTATRFSFGDNESALGEHAWFTANSGEQTSPVGQKEANPWGLHDMYGNVWEWCGDWYEPYSTDVAIDPKGSVDGTYRVGRGGSWSNSAANCRSANRYKLDSSYRYRILGFRLAISAPATIESATGK
jgi:formylglycine-generating enzyme required for sulfatase activity